MLCTVMRAIVLEPGTYTDYKELAAFHYRTGRVCGARRIIRAVDLAHDRRLAGVLVEALPLLASRARNLATGSRYAHGHPGIRRLNAEVRGISRVIVHPVYRGIGLAERMVRHLLAHAQTRHIEAFAAMGRVHPFFERAGMSRFDAPPDARAAPLAAALQRMAMTPADLFADERRIKAAAREHPDVREALRRLAWQRRGGGVHEWIAAARTRMISPVYYLWTNETTPEPMEQDKPIAVECVCEKCENLS